MPPAPTGSIATITTYMTTPQRMNPLSFTTYWNCATPLADYNAAQILANEFHDDFGSQLRLCLTLSTSVLTHRVVYRNGASFFDAYANPVDHPPLHGTAFDDTGALAGDAILPDQDALIIQRRTGISGRRHNGRIFVPFIWEQYANESFLNPDGAAIFHAIASYLGTDHTFAAGVIHARHWNKKDNVMEVVTNCRVMQNLGSRRDRAPRGLNLPV